jgi:hypothetical protein
MYCTPVAVAMPRKSGRANAEPGSFSTSGMSTRNRGPTSYTARWSGSKKLSGNKYVCLCSKSKASPRPTAATSTINWAGTRLTHLLRRSGRPNRMSRLTPPMIAISGLIRPRPAGSPAKSPNGPAPASGAAPNTS